MYLVTYLGDLCNGLTLFIISKKPMPADCWKSGIYSPTVDTLLTILYLCLSSFISRCDRCLFSATFLQTSPGNNSVNSFFLLLLKQLPHFYILKHIFLAICVMWQAQVDGFFAKIQANIDNIKDMWVWLHLLAPWCHQHSFYTEAPCPQLTLRICLNTHTCIC